MKNDLKDCLEQFKGQLNENSKVKKLLKNWNPNILISASDFDDKYTLLVREQEIENVLGGMHHADHEIMIEAEKDVLIEVFSGVSNPAQKVLEGEMAVFGGDTDQIKLDAISLVIWGM